MSKESIEKLATIFGPKMARYQTFVELVCQMITEDKRSPAELKEIIERVAREFINQATNETES